MNPSHSIHIFGAMDLAFTAPTEFSLPPQLFVKDPNVSTSVGEQSEGPVNDWLSNLPRSALMPTSVVGKFSNTSNDSSITGLNIGPLSVLSKTSQWPVINLPLSSRKALRIEVEGGAQAPPAAGGYSAASMLFHQLVAEENGRPYAKTASGSPAEIAKDAAFFSFLKSGLDPNESLASNVSPTQLLFALGELQRRFPGGQSSSDAPELSERMRVGIISEAFVRLLAWQRLGQVIGEVDAVSGLRRNIKGKVGGVRARDEDDNISAVKKSRTEGSAIGPSADLYSDDAPSLSSTETQIEDRIQLFQTLASILSQGPTATGLPPPSSAGGSNSNVVSLTSTATQCRMAYPGLNTTLPFADATRVGSNDLKKAMATSNKSEGTDAAHSFGQAFVDLTHCQVSSPSSGSAGRKLSPIIVQIWNVRHGLIGAEIIGDEESAVANNTIESSQDAATRPRALRIRLPYGVTTIGKMVTDEVSIGVGELEPTDVISAKHLRVMVLEGASPQANTDASSATSNSASTFLPTVRVLSCGGGLGIRIQGGRWTYGDVLNVGIGQTVRFGANLALGFSVKKKAV